MKKVLWMVALVMCLGAAGCSKSDDSFDIDKTYADDDFVLTDRNIKEKLVGEWDIMYMRDEYEPYIISNKPGSELGDMRYLTFRADGSCKLLGLKDAHWYVSNAKVYITCPDEKTGEQKEFEHYWVDEMSKDYFVLTEKMGKVIHRQIEMKRR